MRQRWKIERTRAWLERRRRLAKNYEQLLITTEGMTYLALMQITEVMKMNQDGQTEYVLAPSKNHFITDIRSL